MKARIKLGQRLGVGCFGQTFKAEVVDPDLVRKWGRFVAIKLPLAGEYQADVLNDVVNMARIQGVLSCRPQAARYLVKFFGCEPYKEQYGMVSEFVDGQDLQKWMDTKESSSVLSSAETVTCAIQICEALKTLHDAHIYHRDVKPSNILVFHDKDQLCVKLADFGLSTIVERCDVSNSKIGAVGYAAPENLADKSQPMAPTYDIYSFGLVLYQVCTNGVLPFTSLDFRTVFDEACALDTPFRHPHEFALDIPDCLCRVITKAIEKRPANRYQNIAEMQADLREADKVLNQVIASTSRPMLPELASRIKKIKTELESCPAQDRTVDRAAKIEADICRLTREHSYQPDVFVLLGRFYDDVKWMGQPLKAIEAYRNGLKESPESPELLYHIGAALLKRPNLAEAACAEAVGFLKRAIQNGLSNSLQLAKAKQLVRGHRI